MKNTIKRILSEEVDKKTQSLLNYTQRNGLIKGSKLVGGYNNLKNILKGTDYLTKDNMIKTIQDYFNQPNRLQFLSLDNDLGIEHIELEIGYNHLITLSGLFRRGFEVQTYEKDDDGDFDLIDDSAISFEENNNRKKPLLKTIHLYELVDAIMERWTKENH